MTTITPMPAHESVVYRMDMFKMTTFDSIKSFGLELLRTAYPKGHAEIIRAYTELCQHNSVEPRADVLEKLEQEMAEAAAKELDDESRGSPITVTFPIFEEYHGSEAPLHDRVFISLDDGGEDIPALLSMEDAARLDRVAIEHYGGNVEMVIS